MPTYKITDPSTGKSIKVTGDSPPNEDELNQIFSTVHGVSQPSQKPSTVPQPKTPEWAGRHPNLYGVAGATRETLGPLVEAIGLGGGAAIGAAVGGPGGGVVGGGLGYAAARQGLSSLDTLVGMAPRTEPGKAIEEAVGGAAMEAGGQLIGAGTTAAVNAIKSKVPHIYESALKPSTVLKSSVRARRVGTGLKEEIPVSKGGLEKSKVTIGQINNQIKQTIKDLEGTTISRGGALEPVEELSKKVSRESITPQSDMGRIAQYIQDVKESNMSPEIPIQQAQIFKQTLNKELNEYYNHLAKGKITPEPVMAKTKAAMADGLRKEITKAFPEIQNLNAREASLIEFNKSLERAVSRINNREIVPLAVQIATGRTSGLLKTVAAKVIDQPYVKSKLAIALHKASAKSIGTAAKAGYQSGLIAYNKMLTLPDMVSEAEAGQSTVQKGKSIIGGRGAQIESALGEDTGNSVSIPQPTKASEPSNDMSTAEAKRRLDALIADQERRNRAASTLVPKKKAYIPVKRVEVMDNSTIPPTPVWKYQDSKGKIYDYNPNED